MEHRNTLHMYVINVMRMLKMLWLLMLMQRIAMWISGSHGMCLLHTHTHTWRDNSYINMHMNISISVHFNCRFAPIRFCNELIECSIQCKWYNKLNKLFILFCFRKSQLYHFRSEKRKPTFLFTISSNRKENLYDLVMLFIAEIISITMTCDSWNCSLKIYSLINKI